MLLVLLDARGRVVGHGTRPPPPAATLLGPLTPGAALLDGLERRGNEGDAGARALAAALRAVLDGREPGADWRATGWTVRIEALAPGAIAAAALVVDDGRGRPSPAPPPESAGGDALAALVGLDGVDAARGLAAVGGRAGVYRRLLGVFIDTHAGDGLRLLECLQAGDNHGAAALAHRVRGSAATLGLVDVETAAEAVERACEAASAPLLPHATAFADALSSTLVRLRQALAA